jgi:hypothetical protein
VSVNVTGGPAENRYRVPDRSRSTGSSLKGTFKLQFSMAGGAEQPALLSMSGESAPFMKFAAVHHGSMRVFGFSDKFTKTITAS